MLPPPLGVTPHSLRTTGIGHWTGEILGLKGAVPVPVDSAFRFKIS
jgi:hypothetical protein